MTLLKRWFFQLLIFSLTSSIVMPWVYAAIEVPIQEVVAQVNPVLVEANLEATITLAELQEILIKIDEDLSERIYQLEHAGSQEIITILNSRRQAVIQQLKELQGFDEETVALYLLHSRKEKDGTFFLWTSGVVIAIGIGILAMASIDLTTGIHRPSINRLKSNFEHLINGCSSIVNNFSLDN